MKRNINTLMICSLIALFFAGCRGGQMNQIRTTAFTHVNVVPMTDEVVLRDQTVLVSGDRIIAVGDSTEVDIPRKTRIIDGQGAFLIPGLADMHVHIYQESRDEYTVSPFSLYIANGVTTIRDCGTAPIEYSDTFVLDWRDEILSGDLVGPMIYSSGRTIHGPVGNPAGIVRQRDANGFDFIKLYMELSVDEFVEAQSVAEELGIYSVGHIPYQVGIDRSVAEGLDEIAHIEELSFEITWFENRPTHILSMEQWMEGMVGSVYEMYDYGIDSDYEFDPEEFVQIQGDRLEYILNLLKSNDILVGTTLAVYEVVQQKLYDREAFLAREESAYLLPDIRAAVQDGSDRHYMMFQALGENKFAWRWKDSLDVFLLQKLHEEGIKLVSGTDAGSTSIGVIEGFATHDDLRLLTEFGFTPYEALRTATFNAAYTVKKMTGESDFGIIEVEKRADLVLLGGNPLDDIKHTNDILGVMVRGQWYPREALDEMIAIKK